MPLGHGPGPWPWAQAQGQGPRGAPPGAGAAQAGARSQEPLGSFGLQFGAVWGSLQFAIAIELDLILKKD